MKSDTVRILAFGSKSYYNIFQGIKGRKGGKEGGRNVGRKEIWQEIFSQNIPKIFCVFKKY